MGLLYVVTFSDQFFIFNEKNITLHLWVRLGKIVSLSSLYEQVLKTL